MNNIFIIGYYNHHNIGDEQYKLTFNYTFELLGLTNYTLTYHDCDKLNELTVDDNDIIVLGGGDVLNDYFVDKLIEKFYGKSNKIFAISVGIPYKSIIETGKLFIFDYIFLRNKTDYKLMKKIMPNRTFFIPDISYKLDCIIRDPFSSLNYKLSNTKNIALVLSRSIYNSNYEEIYYQNVKTFATFIIDILETSDYTIVLVPFDTSGSNLNNDTLLYNDILESISETISETQLLNRIVNIDTEISVEQTFSLFKYFTYVVSMKYHGILFSIYNEVPFLALYSSSKVEKLLLDIHWPYFYSIPTHTDFSVKEISSSILRFLFITMIDGRYYFTKIIKELQLQFNKGTLNVFKVFKKDYNKYHYLNFVKEFSDNYCNTKLIMGSIHDKVVEYNACESNKDHVVQYISYLLTGTTNSPYNYGLKTKIFGPSSGSNSVPNSIPNSYDYYEEWKWIIEDYYKLLNHTKITSNNNEGIFNIKYIDQVEYSNCHRSGWQYVYDNIEYLHNENSGLLLDLSIDRTFHWNSSVYNRIGIIPYKKPWIGVIHHTFNTSFSDYNNVRLLENADFIESLKCCKGIIVMSKYLKDLFDDRLDFSVPVYFIPHPTELNVKSFTYNDFLLNDNKKVLHIGAWLRNIYSFYRLELNKKLEVNCFFKKHYYVMSKLAIIGKNNSNYYPNSSEGHSGHHSGGHCSSHSGGHCSSHSGGHCSSHSGGHSGGSNIWYKFFREDLNNTIKSVEITHYKSNEEYDELLSKNIVFLNLVDASAVNTIIECIARRFHQ